MTISMSQMPHGASSCPNCGIGLPAFSQDVQQQIEDLQAQIRLLSQKATSAGMLAFHLLLVSRLTAT